MEVIKTFKLPTGEQVIVSLSDFLRVSSHKWSMTGSRTKYVVAQINGRKTFLHRLILGLRKADRRQGDHRNRNTLDNRRTNLRIATRSQNGCNRKSHRKFKGTHFNPNQRGNRPWQARIVKHGKLISLGCYPTEEEAARAYDNAALRLHGEFALLNFSTKLKV